MLASSMQMGRSFGSLARSLWQVQVLKMLTVMRKLLMLTTADSSMLYSSITRQLSFSPCLPICSTTDRMRSHRNFSVLLLRPWPSLGTAMIPESGRRTGCDLPYHYKQCLAIYVDLPSPAAAECTMCVLVALDLIFWSYSFSASSRVCPSGSGLLVSSSLVKRQRRSTSLSPTRHSLRVNCFYGERDWRYSRMKSTMYCCFWRPSSWQPRRAYSESGSLSARLMMEEISSLEVSWLQTMMWWNFRLWSRALPMQVIPRRKSTSWAGILLKWMNSSMRSSISSPSCSMLLSFSSSKYFRTTPRQFTGVSSLAMASVSPSSSFMWRVPSSLMCSNLAGMGCFFLSTVQNSLSCLPCKWAALQFSSCMSTSLRFQLRRVLSRSSLMRVKPSRESVRARPFTQSTRRLRFMNCRQPYSASEASRSLSWQNSLQMRMQLPRARLRSASSSPSSLSLMARAFSLASASSSSSMRTGTSLSSKCTLIRQRMLLRRSWPNSNTHCLLTPSISLMAPLSISRSLAFSSRKSFSLPNTNCREFSRLKPLSWRRLSSQKALVSLRKAVKESSLLQTCLTYSLTTSNSSMSSQVTSQLSSSLTRSLRSRTEGSICLRKPIEDWCLLSSATSLSILRPSSWVRESLNSLRRRLASVKASLIFMMLKHFSSCSCWHTSRKWISSGSLRLNLLRCCSMRGYRQKAYLLALATMSQRCPMLSTSSGISSYSSRLKHIRALKSRDSSRLGLKWYRAALSRLFSWQAVRISWASRRRVVRQRWQSAMSSAMGSPSGFCPAKKGLSWQHLSVSQRKSLKTGANASILVSCMEVFSQVLLALVSWPSTSSQSGDLYFSPTSRVKVLSCPSRRVKSRPSRQSSSMDSGMLCSWVSLTKLTHSLPFISLMRLTARQATFLRSRSCAMWARELRTSSAWCISRVRILLIIPSLLRLSVKASQTSFSVMVTWSISITASRLAFFSASKTLLSISVLMAYSFWPWSHLLWLKVLWMALHMRSSRNSLKWAGQLKLPCHSPLCKVAFSLAGVSGISFGSCEESRSQLKMLTRSSLSRQSSLKCSPNSLRLSLGPIVLRDLLRVCVMDLRRARSNSRPPRRKTSQQSLTSATLAFWLCSSLSSIPQRATLKAWWSMPSAGSGMVTKHSCMSSTPRTRQSSLLVLLTRALISPTYSLSLRWNSGQSTSTLRWGCSRKEQQMRQMASNSAKGSWARVSIPRSSDDRRRSSPIQLSQTFSVSKRLLLKVSMNMPAGVRCTRLIWRAQSADSRPTSSTSAELRAQWVVNSLMVSEATGTRSTCWRRQNVTSWWQRQAVVVSKEKVINYLTLLMTEEGSNGRFTSCISPRHRKWRKSVMRPKD